MRQISEDIVQLRNETVRYLIRAQGPTPSFLGGGSQPELAQESTERALAEIGRPARQRALGLERELSRAWIDLQPLLADLARAGSGSVGG